MWVSNIWTKWDNRQFGFQTPVSYIVSSGLLAMLEVITQLPGVDINKPDNEGNTPLHFAAQAGKYNSRLSQIEKLKVLSEVKSEGKTQHFDADITKI